MSVVLLFTPFTKMKDHHVRKKKLRLPATILSKIYSRKIYVLKIRYRV